MALYGQTWAHTPHPAQSVPSMVWTLSMLDIAGHWNFVTQVLHFLQASWSTKCFLMMAPFSSLFAMRAHSLRAMMTLTLSWASPS